MKDFLEIVDVKALEILDSRGNPTIRSRSCIRTEGFVE